MVHGKNRIPYWIDRSLTGLAGPEYDATISFGLPFELGDCPIWGIPVDESNERTYIVVTQHSLARLVLLWLSRIM